MESLLLAPKPSWEASLARCHSWGSNSWLRKSDSIHFETSQSCSSPRFSDTSDSGFEDPQGGRRISLAKQILAEATSTFSNVSAPVKKGATSRNTGAMGPLLALLQNSHTYSADKLRAVLYTFSFLIVDTTNRRLAHELKSNDMLLDLLEQEQDSSVLSACLEAIYNLNKSDNKDKLALWSHPKKQSLLALIHPRHPPSLIIDALRTCRQLAFTSTPALLEPMLLSSVAQLLNPTTDTDVLLKCLKLLNQASRSPDADQMSGWHSTVFKLVPLLQSSSASAQVAMGPVLEVLAHLSEHMAFKNMFYAAGCVTPLLALLSQSSSGLAVQAACIISELCEGGLSRDKLCQDAAVVTMLCALHPEQSMEVVIALLYGLACLATYKTTVAECLKQAGAVPVLLQLMESLRDEDAALGVLQLLDILGASCPSLSNAQSGRSSCQLSPQASANHPTPPAPAIEAPSLQSIPSASDLLTFAISSLQVRTPSTVNHAVHSVNISFNTHPTANAVQYGLFNSSACADVRTTSDRGRSSCESHASPCRSHSNCADISLHNSPRSSPHTSSPNTPHAKAPIVAAYSFHSSPDTSVPGSMQSSAHSSRHGSPANSAILDAVPQPGADMSGATTNGCLLSVPAPVPLAKQTAGVAAHPAVCFTGC